MTSREKILCHRCGRTLGEVEPQTWLVVVSSDIDEAIEESYSDYQFLCNECYRAQIKSDKAWEDADGEEPYLRTVHMVEEGEDENE